MLFGGNDTPGTWLPSPLSFPGEANGFLGGKSEGAFHTWTLFPVSVCAVSHWNPGTAQDVEQAETHMERSPEPVASPHAMSSAQTTVTISVWLMTVKQLAHSWLTPGSGRERESEGKSKKISGLK